MNAGFDEQILFLEQNQESLSGLNAEHGLSLNTVLLNEDTPASQMYRLKAFSSQTENDVCLHKFPLVQIKRQKLIYNNKDCRVLILKDVSSPAEITKLSA